VQFAAGRCPKGSVYGFVRAFSPLLEEPLEGLVYLCSSGNLLPDVVFDLEGIVSVEVVGFIDSVNGGIRNSFEVVPDVPVSKFVLEMQGGKKGLLVNSVNLCAGKHRATVKLIGHNGKVYNTRPLVKASCKGKGHKRGKRHARRRAGGSGSTGLRAR
jgi:hypothetical protein